MVYLQHAQPDGRVRLMKGGGYQHRGIALKQLLLVASLGFALTSGSALAADMAVKAPPPPPLPPPFSWTGSYIGGEVGGVWANGSLHDSLRGFNVSTDHSGAIGGAVVGYNYQVTNLRLRRGSELRLDLA